MSGGYDGYLESLRKVCEIVDDLNPTSSELAGQISKSLGVTDKAAGLKESFLRKAGIIQVEDGLCRLSSETKHWLETGNPGILIAVLHSRCRFVGEMIAALKNPLTTDEARSVASDYGLLWTTNSQIDNRRGWLQSAKLIEVTQDRKLVATEAGRKLARQLELYEPADGGPTDDKSIERESGTLGDEPERTEARSASFDESLTAEILEASTDSSNPDRFERAVREAFAFLGFEARHLGGSGKTDVLLYAPLGRGTAYRVAVDAKTARAGVLGDHQVDWLTLEEHRLKHQAEYSMLVGPRPSSGRLTRRAEENEVAVLSADLLAGLCRQHAEAPLGLADYRELFARQSGGGQWERHGGEVDTAALDEKAQEAKRMRELASAVVNVLSERCMIVGPLGARDLWLIILERGDVAEGSSEKEIQVLLEMLSHPLVRAVDGSAEGGYVLSSKAAVTHRRLRHLAGSIAPETDS